jgi:hypothetical protein
MVNTLLPGDDLPARRDRIRGFADRLMFISDCTQRGALRGRVATEIGELRRLQLCDAQIGEGWTAPVTSHPADQD